MRRPNGTGTIVKLSGNRRNPFAVRVSTRDKYGMLQQKTLSYHKTGKEAQAALDQYNASRAAGTAPAAEHLEMTVKAVYSLWSARKYVKAGNASIMSYKAAWGRLSCLADMKMREVTVDHMQQLIDQDEAEGLSKSSINNDKLLMKALFKFAMERDIIVKDYSEFVEMPSVDTKYEKGFFSDLQMEALVQMATDGLPWADTVLMLCYTGFRITEFLTLTRFSYHTDGDYLMGGVKTIAGRDRIVPVHPKIKPYLTKWLARGGDTIICDNSGLAIASPKYRSAMFKPIAIALGVPQATPHWCRHTFASRLHAAGVSELEQKRLMGHANKDVTDHYTHTDWAQLAAAIRRLA